MVGRTGAGVASSVAPVRQAILLAVPMVFLADCAPTCTPPASPPPAEIVVPALGSGTTPYQVPVADVDAAEWGTTHGDYPATDIFVGCGALIVAPVNGVVLESRRVNSYDPRVDNPATRGGLSVAIVGDDGVRYYLAHFQQIEDGIERGVRVAVGQPLGLMGRTGRASACHLHLGLSPPCPGEEWSVRRGVIWPHPYLDDWRTGGQRSPVEEVAQWVSAFPNACAEAMADPNAGDSI
jgi:peptidoglycan LD-endopeptidase LytH